MLRLVTNQKTRVVTMVASRFSIGSRGYASFSTNATEVFDTEANKQQMEQVSEQMEKAMHKEKQKTQDKQVTVSNHVWETSMDVPKDPTGDDRMDHNNNKTDGDSSKDPGDGKDPTRAGDDVDKTGKEIGGQTLMDQVKVAAQTIKENVKSTMKGAKEMTKDAASYPSTDIHELQSRSTSSSNQTPDKQKSKVKQYSESRQNASLL